MMLFKMLTILKMMVVEMMMMMMIMVVVVVVVIELYCMEYADATFRRIKMVYDCGDYDENKDGLRL